jgi:hypothetical protein
MLHAMLECTAQMCCDAQSVLISDQVVMKLHKLSAEVPELEPVAQGMPLSAPAQTIKSWWLSQNGGAQFTTTEVVSTRQGH